MPKFISDEEMMKLENQKGFLSDEQMAALESSGPSALEAGIQGAFEGASLGWRDELAGALEAGGQFLGVKGLGGKFSDIGLQDSISADQLGKVYEETKQRRERELSKIQEAQPEAFLAGNLAGGLATGLAIPNPATIAGRVATGAGTGALAGAGSAKEGETLEGAAKGLATGALFSGASEGIQSAIKSGAPLLAGGAKDLSNMFVRKATGATGKQASNFKPGIEDYLLKKGIVGFGDTVEDVAKKSSAQLEDSGKIIGNIIEELDASGQTIDKQTLMNNLIKRYDDLNESAALKPVAEKLRKVIENIDETTPDQILPSLAQSEKLAFENQARNLFGREDIAKAEKEAYRAYKDIIEGAAEEQGGDVLNKLKGAKSTYGILKPVEEAASARAQTQAQQQLGGWGDMISAGAGAAFGGIPGAVATTVGRRVIAPRAASSLAVTTDLVSRLLKETPERLGKYNFILQNAAHRGPHAVAITDYLLSQQDPEYREMKRQLDENR